MADSKIEWTEKTWNPAVGCTKVSQGCKHCYAEIMHARLQSMGVAKYADDFWVVKPYPEHLNEPRTWKKGVLVFVNSMSDLFHADLPFEYIQQVFQVMNECPQHTFQVLTKRSGRLAELAPQLEWHRNIWIGVSVENQKTANERIPHLLTVPATVRFLSCEPLLGEVDIAESVEGTNTFWGGTETGGCMSGEWLPQIKNHAAGGISWVIVGGESGPGCRPIHPDWVRSLRDQCKQNSVPFFFKQWGGVNKKSAGRILDGRTYDEMPIRA